MRTASGSWPSASAACTVARDRPVVILAPDVDQLVEPAAELLADVADVGGEVRRLPVRPDRRPDPCRRRTPSTGTRWRHRPRTRGPRRAARRRRARPSPPSWIEPSLFHTSKRHAEARRGWPRCRRATRPMPSGRRASPPRRPGRLGGRHDLSGTAMRPSPSRSRRDSRPRGPARPSGAPGPISPSVADLARRSR